MRLDSNSSFHIIITMSAVSGSPAKPVSSSSSKKPLSTTKKPISKKPKAAAAKPKPKPSQRANTAARPSWKDIIKECIAANKGDARQGVSRNTIKRYAEEVYKIDVSGTNLYQLNRAIASGTDGGIFVLPKGPSGKVKLAPKATPLTSGSKENSKPATTAVPPPAKKTAGAPKKVLAGKVKSTTTTKKTTTPSKRGAPKKVITESKSAAKTKPAPTKRKAPGRKAVSAKKT